MRDRLLRISLLYLAIGAVPAVAQTTGQIEGLVRDPAGLPVPGVTLRIVETRTSAERQLSTDSRGWYLALTLAPGSYEIKLAHPGFRSELRRGVTLSAGQAARIDFALQLGETSDTVVVVGEAAPVSVAPGDWGGLIPRAKLESLPLNGRDLFDLAAQQPGAMVATTAAKNMTVGAGIRISVNGARPNQNSFRMDGVYINDATSSAPTSAAGRLLGLESIGELHLVSSPFDAEYGRAAGAVVTAVSRSGSNQWHSSAYEFLRNSALDARNFFDPAGVKTPPLRKNQFGGMSSGPLRRSALFFLVNYEGVRETSSRTLYSVTPNQAARLGQLPGRTIAVAPQIVPYLALYPLPNGRDYGDGTGEFISAGVTSSREDYVTAKLDIVVSSRVRHALRYSYDNALTTRPDPIEVFTFLDDSHYHFLNTESLFVQSPRTIHSFRGGFSRVWNSQTNDQPASITPSMAFVPGHPSGSMSMSSGLSNFGGPTGNNIALLPRRFVVNDFQLNYTFEHIRGAHALRLGGAFDRLQFNQRSENGANGTYGFSSLVEFLQARPRAGDLMMPGSDTIRGWRQNLFFGFVQDEFRASPRLNITLGVRYETYSTPTEVNGKIATLRDPMHDSAVTIGGPLFVNPSQANFAPRISVAFDPLGKGRTVIRAGAGIFYDLLSARELVVAGVRMPPFFNQVSLTQPAFPNLLEAANNVPPVNSLDMLDYRISQPYVMQLQLMVQQQLTNGTMLRLGYVGTRGVHLTGLMEETNPVRPQVLPDGHLFFPENGIRLNPVFSRIRRRGTQFDSSYHGFQAGMETRPWHGIGLQINYSWSKSLDNTSMVIRSDYLNGSNFPTMFDLRMNRGRSDFDLRHVFHGNVSWMLPQWRGSAAGRLLGGWEVYAMVQAQTGPGFSPTIGFDRARLSPGGTGDVGERPVYTGGPAAQVILGDPQRWFDAGFFALPPAGMYGNLGRNALDGPGLVMVDLALHKILWHTDRHSIRLRVEAFNVPNHPNFQIPSARTLFTSSLNRVGSAGRITETTTTSRQIQMALKWTF
jgi:hypothetical protein